MDKKYIFTIPMSDLCEAVAAECEIQGIEAPDISEPSFIDSISGTVGRMLAPIETDIRLQGPEHSYLEIALALPQMPHGWYWLRQDLGALLCSLLVPGLEDAASAIATMIRTS